MRKRPTRPRIENEIGLVQTPPSGRTQHERLGKGDAILLIGIGPEPSVIFDELAPGRAVYAIEAPLFKAQMPSQWNKAVSSHVQWLEESEITEELLDRCEIWIYLPGARLFPSFYGPLAAKARVRKLLAVPAVKKRSVILPTANDALLAKEMTVAFQSAGFAVHALPPKQIGTALPELLQHETPELFFSINFKGLDPHGEVFHLLEAAGIPVCAWCVDNPFHLLSGLRAPYWKRAMLAVTDASFIPALRQLGAHHVHHVPLAASPQLFTPRGAQSGLAERLAFVGRLEFPGRDKFFAGASIPDWQWRSAQLLLEQGGTPDFEWWVERLEIAPLWPGNNVRRAGLGAENASRVRRIQSLTAASSSLPVTVFGDGGWEEILSGTAEIRGPVDYYGALPDIYREAAWSLNVTSLLLPAGCTQRHFDVWIAGGLLLTDATPGLAIFPEELTREINYRSPAEIAPLAQRLAPGTQLRKDIQSAWQQEILANHTYERRVQALLDAL